MHDHEKSDPAIVAAKPSNKAGQPAAELVEPRAGAEGNVSQQSTGRAQYRETVSQALKRIRHQVAPLDTRGGSRMPELGPYGSVRGARGNSRPYRESRDCAGRLPVLMLWTAPTLRHRSAIGWLRWSKPH